MRELAKRVVVRSTRTPMLFQHRQLFSDFSPAGRPVLQSIRFRSITCCNHAIILNTRTSD